MLAVVQVVLAPIRIVMARSGHRYTRPPCSSQTTRSRWQTSRGVAGDMGQFLEKSGSLTHLCNIHQERTSRWPAPPLHLHGVHCAALDKTVGRTVSGRGARTGSTPVVIQRWYQLSGRTRSYRPRRPRHKRSNARATACTWARTVREHISPSSLMTVYNGDLTSAPRSPDG